MLNSVDWVDDNDSVHACLLLQDSNHVTGHSNFDRSVGLRCFMEYRLCRPNGLWTRGRLRSDRIQ